MGMKHEKFLAPLLGARHGNTHWSNMKPCDEKKYEALEWAVQASNINQNTAQEVQELRGRNENQDSRNTH